MHFICLLFTYDNLYPLWWNYLKSFLLSLNLHVFKNLEINIDVTVVCNINIGTT